MKRLAFTGVGAVAALAILLAGCSDDADATAVGGSPAQILSQHSEPQVKLADNKVSIGSFPYDLTVEAVQTVTSIVRNYANVYTVQLDNGIPWEAALTGSSFEPALMDQWRRHKESIAPHHEVYLAIAPLAEDRTSWSSGFEGKRAPEWARNEQRLTEELKTSYVNYVLRAIDYFEPSYLNLGVEAGDMAAKKPAKWPLFEDLFAHSASAVRAKHPSLKLGISFGLPLLMDRSVLRRAQSLIDRSDYIGISFYPYMSDFYVKLGAAPLPEPPDQWRKPLEWLRQNVDKPVAICETGYSSDTVSLKTYGLVLEGNQDLQSRYVADLAAIARRDEYLFTVFFLAVDYDALMEKIRASDDTHKLWGRIGFFDRNLRAKPAWPTYRQAWLNLPVEDPLSAPGPLRIKPAISSAASSGADLGFASSADLFTAPAPDQVTLEKSAEHGSFMRWRYSYRASQFAWAVRELPAGAAKGTQGLALNLRSDRSDPLLLQVEELDGEAFYHVLKPAKDWAPISVNWQEFILSPDKKRNGTLEPERIVRLMIADGAAVDSKATGSRTVDISQLKLRRAAEQR
jgi:hypothetical protein